jgi:hypothetical protein
MTDEPYEYQHIVHNYGPRLPVEEYVEIGADGWEVRKVEVFEDGHLTFSDDVLYTGRTGLSELKALSIDALNAMTRVTARVITAAEFERAWERAHAEPFTVRRLG